MKSHTKDKLSGNVKEKVGELTDNDKMKREGRFEKASGNVKEKASDAVDAVKDRAKKMSD